MSVSDILYGKRVLIVDDEKDVLDLLIELLKVCKIDTATSFGEAKKLLESSRDDIAVLDIMGVNGFELLKVANDHEIPAVMLTAHALNAGSLDTSIKGGGILSRAQGRDRPDRHVRGRCAGGDREEEESMGPVAQKAGRHFRHPFHWTGLEKRAEGIFGRTSRSRIGKPPLLPFATPNQPLFMTQKGRALAPGALGGP